MVDMAVEEVERWTVQTRHDTQSGLQEVGHVQHQRLK